MSRSPESINQYKKYLKRYQKERQYLEYLSARRDSESDPDLLESLDHRIRTKTQRAEQTKKEILDLIETLSNNKEKEILILHFVECKSIAEITSIVGYSERYIYTLYARAVKNLLHTGVGEILRGV